MASFSSVSAGPIKSKKKVFVKRLSKPDLDKVLERQNNLFFLFEYSSLKDRKPVLV
jgi:hypothetical protein